MDKTDKVKEIRPGIFIRPPAEKIPFKYREVRQDGEHWKESTRSERTGSK